jgi:hypothetical protein
MTRKAQIVWGLVLLAAAGCGSSGAGADGGGHAGGGAGGGGGHAAGGGTGGGGGKGGAGGSLCQPIIPGDGTMTWDDNGNAECGTITEASRVTSTSQDFIEIIGASPTNGYSVGLTVVSYSEGPLGGPYHCKNDAGISALYVAFTYRGTVEDCTITFDNAGTPGGAHATGSFSATVIGPDGGSIEVTNGVFDTPLMLVGG